MYLRCMLHDFCVLLPTEMENLEAYEKLLKVHQVQDHGQQMALPPCISKADTELYAKLHMYVYSCNKFVQYDTSFCERISLYTFTNNFEIYYYRTQTCDCRFNVPAQCQF